MDVLEYSMEVGAMEKPATRIKLTYEDYRNAPESERERYELFEGELVMVPSPSFKHQLILGNLVDLLRKFVSENDLGMVLFAPLDVILSDDTVLQPDILFITNKRAKIIAEEGIRGAPDLVIEILSEATAKRDRTYKRALYARHGVKEYWLVDPATKTVEVLELQEQGFSRVARYACKEKAPLKSPLLAGLSIDLEKVF